MSRAVLGTAMAAVLFAGAMLAMPATAAPALVHLAPASPGAVRFTINVPVPKLVRLEAGDATARLDLDGFLLEGKPGAPAMPVRVLLVAVPPLGAVRVSGVASELRIDEGVLLASTATRDAAGEVHQMRSSAAYGAKGSAQPEAAKLLDVTWVRNQRVARIAIMPSAYEPSARRLTTAARIDVEVQVQPMDVLGPPVETSDPYEPVYESALVNYAQGKNWRRPATSVLAAAARRMGMSVAGVTELAAPPDTSVFVGRQWARLAITQAGFYSVNYSNLRLTALINQGSFAFDSLRLFTLPGYPQLPENTYCDSCDLKEVAIGVIDVGNDGLFSVNDDTFYFFAQGPSGWADDYNLALADTLYLNHPYETRNIYYLTVATGPLPVAGAPRRIGRRDATPQVASGATPVTTFADRAHFEQDVEYWPDANPRGSSLFWEKWYWRSLSNTATGNSFTTTFALPGADTLQAARLRLRQWGLTDNVIFNGCGNTTPDHLLDVRLNAFGLRRGAWNSFIAAYGGQYTFDTTGVFLNRVSNSLQLTVPVVSAPDCPNRSDRSALAWFDLYYQRFFQPQDDVLRFRGPATAGLYRYDVGPFKSSAQPRLFDITDPLSPSELTAAATAFGPVAGGFQLSIEDTQSVQHRFLVVPDSFITAVHLPVTAIDDAPFTSLDNLRSRTNGADYLVIYYDGFAAAATALGDARKLKLPLTDKPAPYVTKTIPISALYDQFSGGRTDPAAIRNFLRAAYFNWSLRPRFVTFIGDASYDYKNITGRAPSGQPGSLLPTYENGFDDHFNVLRQFATDDWLLNVNDANSFVPDFYGGRLPADDAASALKVVNGKILAYENAAPVGEYRNRVMLIADDDQQGESPDQLAWTHVQQTTDLDTTSTPDHLDRTYVYLHTYPSGTGNTKPGARADIKNTINNGVALFNYVGHGSPFKISDESVFIDSDAGTLTNGLRMPLFVAASCDVGKFNDPTVQSLGERLVMASDAGAIGVISATEQAFSSDNSLLNRFLYKQMFRRDAVVVGADTLAGFGQYHMAVSAALLSAKISAPGTNEINNSKYQYMGDAATRLNAPRLWADIQLTDVAGVPITELKRGQTVVVSGRVLDAPGGTFTPFDGVASLFVEDSAPIDNTGLNPDPNFLSHYYSVNYRFRAGPIYHGDVTCTNGTFEGRFVVPADATTGAYGRVRAYLDGRTLNAKRDDDGAGSVKVQVSSAPIVTSDAEGPRITLSFVGGATSVRPDAQLRIDLFDQSGIMTTGHSLQNSIVVTIDDNTTSRVDVTGSFRYAADSYQSGTASFALPSLSAGHHRIRVSAADNLASGINASAHRNSSTLEFDVISTPTLNVARTYLFPNPTRSSGPGAGGTFIVDAPGDSVNTLIRLYTVSGKLIRTLKSFGALGQVQIPWDGRDAEGDALANGTYLYKVYVNGRLADGTSSASQKAIAEGRVVIVHH